MNIIQRLGEVFRKSKPSELGLENKIDIAEYNKAKEALEKTKAEHEALIQSNNRIREETKSIAADIEKLQLEIRTQKILNILSAVPLTDEKRKELLQSLVNGNLTIDTIRESYEPLTNKKNDIKGTKLPQRSTPDHIR